MSLLSKTASLIQVRPRKCLDGKIRLKPVQGYDCVYYKWHNIPYIWSECIKNKTQYYKDCKHCKSPYKCPNFKEKESAK